MTTSTSGLPASPLGDARGSSGPTGATVAGLTTGSSESNPASEATTITATAPPPVATPRAAPGVQSPAPAPVLVPTPAAPAPNGHSRPAAAVVTPDAAKKPGSKRRRLFLLVPILLVILVVAGVLGYRYWYDSTYFISTDNASVTGDLVQVGSLNAGRIVSAKVEIGRTVQAGQEIAVVAMPQEIAGASQGVGPKVSVTGNTDSLVPVYAPLTGIVAARMGYVGGTVAAGQPIYSLVDPSQVWVKANVEESMAWRVANGQLVDIHVDALNRDFTGHVEAITPASAATFSLLPSNNASGNFTKVTQYVPVKIVVDTGGTVLPLGTSAEVRIHVREPQSAYPLPWQQ